MELLLIILLKKANIEVNVENLAYFTRMGITKDREDFIKRVGICLSIGNTAKDILLNYRVLTNSVPLDIFYATVVAELNLIREDYSKLSKPDSGLRLDLSNILKKVYEEKSNINEGKMYFIPNNRRFILVPFEKMKINTRAAEYMNISLKTK